MINQNDQKRIVTNEDLFDHISGLKLEMKITKEDLYDAISELRRSTLDGFDKVFQTIDDARAELRLEFKNDIIELRKEMNQRFTIVDKKFDVIDGRLFNIEDNMVYQHQLAAKFA